MTFRRLQRHRFLILVNDGINYVRLLQLRLLSIGLYNGMPINEVNNALMNVAVDGLFAINHCRLQLAKLSFLNYLHFVFILLFNLCLVVHPNLDFNFDFNLQLLFPYEFCVSDILRYSIEDFLHALFLFLLSRVYAIFGNSIVVFDLILSNLLREAIRYVASYGPSS